MRIICHPSLGKLARYLRMLGIDTRCLPEQTWADLIATGGKNVIFFTKSTPHIPAGACIVTSSLPKEQAREVRDIIRPYVVAELILSRCLDCNEILLPVHRNKVEQKVPEYLFHQVETFTTCPSCGKLYWKGSHSASMGRLLQDIFDIPAMDI